LGIPEQNITEYTQALLTYLTDSFNTLTEELPDYFNTFWTTLQLEEYARQGDDNEQIKTEKGNDKMNAKEDELPKEFKEQLRERDELLLTLKERIARIHARITNSNE
jgi:hypothetical protein